ncbi:hypothetical protein [Streptomyces sp. NPDC092370]|uniref:hypothetical protein n=1 Tax=Streptomyces sp. NPDC092370 TaxID=3366016 RepID=UPI00382B4250
MPHSPPLAAKRLKNVVTTSYFCGWARWMHTVESGDTALTEQCPAADPSGSRNR